MARSRTVILTWTGGEWSPKLDSRPDLAKSRTAARTITNMKVEPYGRTVRRSGFRFIAAAKVAS